MSLQRHCNILHTFCFLIDYKPSSDTKILISRKQIAVLPKTTKAHAIWVSLENLVPAPEHITIHVVHDTVMAAKKECFVPQDGFVARRDSSGVDGFWVGACREK